MTNKKAFQNCIADQWIVEVKKEVKICKNSPYILVEGMRRGSIVLKDEHGFGYNKTSREAKDGITTWMCRKWQSRCKCPCSIKVSGDRIILQRNQHVHGPNE